MNIRLRKPFYVHFFVLCIPSDFPLYFIKGIAYNLSVTNALYTAFDYEHISLRMYATYIFIIRVMYV